MEIPACEPAKLTFVCEMAPILIWSNARVKNAANVLQKATVLSLVAHPIATPTRFCSAMKHSINLSGWAFYSRTIKFEFKIVFTSKSILILHNILLTRAANCRKIRPSYRKL